MRCLSCSELERLVVDLPASYPGADQLAGDGGGQSRWPAQVDVVVDEPGDAPAQLPAAQRVVAKLGAAAGGEPGLWRAAGGDLLELAAEHGVAQAANPVDQGEVTGRGGQRLEQRAQRGDADTPGDQQHLAAAARRPGERT